VGVFKSEAVNKGHTVVMNSPSDITLKKNMRYFQPKAEKLIYSTVKDAELHPLFIYRFFWKKKPPFPYYFLKRFHLIMQNLNE